MNMNSKISFLALTVAAGLAVAQDPSDPDAPRRGPSFEALQQALQLSDAQLDALRENAAALREAARDVMEGARETRTALREELQSENPDQTLVAQYLITLSDNRQEVRELRERHRNSALALLDETQKAALADIEEALQTARLARGAAALHLLDAPKGFDRGGRGPGWQGPGGPRPQRDARRGGPKPPGPVGQ